MIGGGAKRRVWIFGDRLCVIEMERKGMGKEEYRACCFLEGRVVKDQELALANECGNGIVDSERLGAEVDMYGDVDVDRDAVGEDGVLADTLMGSPAASVRTKVSGAGCG